MSETPKRTVAIDGVTYYSEHADQYAWDITRAAIAALGLKLRGDDHG